MPTFNRAGNYSKMRHPHSVARALHKQIGSHCQLQRKKTINFDEKETKIEYVSGLTAMEAVISLVIVH